MPMVYPPLEKQSTPDTVMAKRTVYRRYDITPTTINSHIRHPGGNTVFVFHALPLFVVRLIFGLEKSSSDEACLYTSIHRRAVVFSDPVLIHRIRCDLIFYFLHTEVASGFRTRV